MEKQIFTNFQVEDLIDLIRNCVKDEFKKLSLPEEKENQEELVSIEDLQKIFSVSKVTIHKWKKKGLIPFYKMNRRVYFKKSEVIDSMKHKKRKLEV